MWASGADEDRVSRALRGVSESLPYREATLLPPSLPTTRKEISWSLAVFFRRWLSRRGVSPRAWRVGAGPQGPALAPGGRAGHADRRCSAAGAACPLRRGARPHRLPTAAQGGRRCVSLRFAGEEMGARGLGPPAGPWCGQDGSQSPAPQSPRSVATHGAGDLGCRERGPSGRLGSREGLCPPRAYPRTAPPPGVWRRTAPPQQLLPAALCAQQQLHLGAAPVVWVSCCPPPTPLRRESRPGAWAWPKPSFPRAGGQVWHLLVGGCGGRGPSCRQGPSPSCAP